MQKQMNNEQVAWMTGLRGIAACIVVLYHMFILQIPLLFRSYWDEPSSENACWIQLPPFRLVVAGPAMVRIFFVLSGHSLSTSLQRFRLETVDLEFYQALTSAAVRRGLRLYIPVFVWSAFSHVLWYLGFYGWNVLGSTCPDAQPWSSIWPHMRCFAVFFRDITNCLDMPRNYGLSPALWTMPYELRASLVAYVVTLSLAKTKPLLRLLVVTIVVLYSLCIGRNELCACFSGYLIGELKHCRKAKGFQPYSVPLHTNKWIERSLQILEAVGLVVGICIISLPYHETEIPPDWEFRNFRFMPRWKDDVVAQNCWYAIGSIILVAALHGLPVIQHMLMAYPLQFLGKISYSLYLTHHTVLYILRDRLMNLICHSLSKMDYETIKMQPEKIGIFKLAWLIGGTAMLGIAVLVATCFTHLVERHSSRWAVAVERWSQACLYHHLA